MSQKLRIGLLMDSNELPLWEFILIERLINSYYASVELVILNENRKTKISLLKRIMHNWKYIVIILYSKLDQKLFNVQPNAFKPKDTTDLLNEIPIIKVKPISKNNSDYFENNDIVKIKQHNIDILIKFGFRILRGEILQSARYGVWSYHHGDNNINRDGYAGFMEVMDNRDVTGSILQILTEDLNAGRVLYRSFSQTDKHSIHRNRNNFYWKSMSFLPRKIEELYKLGDVKFFNKVDEQNKSLSPCSNRLVSTNKLNNKEMFKLITTHKLRYIAQRFVKLIYFEQWIILFSIKKGLSTSFWRFKKIMPPKDRFFADPFIIKKENTYYIFIEEFVYKSNKGHIAIIKMDENGSYEEPVKIIDKPYHLSYPFIFKDKDDYFLIPESNSNKTIELYKCIEFPFKWEFQRNLMKNIDAVDTTLFHYKRKWWLFANIVENPGASYLDELFLFYAESFNTEEWIPHPLNPVISDVRKSRPAGNIFIHDGKLIRPSQNSSNRYGFGLKINEITILNENEYEEIEIESFEPDWDKQILAIHTLNNVGNLTVADGLLRRKRFW